MERQNLSEISTSLEKTLVNSDLTAVTIQLADLSIDRFLNDDLLKGIPILSTLAGLGKTALTVRDYLFLKKIIYFISGIKEIPKEERNEVISLIESSEKYAIKVGEKLLYIIDKSEDHKITEIIAKLFSAFLKKEIDYSQFLKCSMVVNSVYYEDLKNFVSQDREHGYKTRDINDLLSSGLFDIEFEEIDVTVEDQDDHHASRRSEKYKTRVDGGEIYANISQTGRIIRKVLRGKLN